MIFFTRLYVAVCNHCGRHRTGADRDSLRRFSDRLYREGWHSPPPYPNDEPGDLVRIPTLCPKCRSKQR